MSAILPRINRVTIPVHEATYAQEASERMKLGISQSLKKRIRDHLIAQHVHGMKLDKLVKFYNKLWVQTVQRQHVGDSVWLPLPVMQRCMPRPDDGVPLCENTCRRWRAELEEAGLLEQRYGKSRLITPRSEPAETDRDVNFKNTLSGDKMALSAKYSQADHERTIETPSLRTPPPPDLALAMADVERLRRIEAQGAVPTRPPQKAESQFSKKIGHPPQPPESYPPKTVSKPVFQPLRPPKPLGAQEGSPQAPHLAEPPTRPQAPQMPYKPPDGLSSDMLDVVIKAFPQKPQRPVERPECILVEVGDRQTYLDPRYFKAAGIGTFHISIALHTLKREGRQLDGDLARRIFRYAQEVQRQERAEGRKTDQYGDEAHAAFDLAPRFFKKHHTGNRRWLLEDDP